MRVRFDKDTTYNAILYILERMGGSCDIHKICKLLYYADQRSLSIAGRTITGDHYIAMEFGPVPSNVEDMFKALRGKSFYFDKDYLKEAEQLFRFTNRYFLHSDKKADMDYLSGTDVKCLDYALDKYKNLSFDDLTRESHGLAWTMGRAQGGEMSLEDIMAENDETDDYIQYVKEQEELQLMLLS